MKRVAGSSTHICDTQGLRAVRTLVVRFGPNSSRRTGHRQKGTTTVANVVDTDLICIFDPRYDIGKTVYHFLAEAVSE